MSSTQITVIILFTAGFLVTAFIRNRIDMAAGFLRIILYPIFAPVFIMSAIWLIAGGGIFFLKFLALHLLATLFIFIRIFVLGMFAGLIGSAFIIFARKRNAAVTNAALIHFMTTGTLVALFIYRFGLPA